jgi:hypothetical protein
MKKLSGGSKILASTLKANPLAGRVEQSRNLSGFWAVLVQKILEKD